MKKYYHLDWPDSQEFMDNPESIQAEGMSYFVPCEIYDKKYKRNN